VSERRTAKVRRVGRATSAALRVLLGVSLGSACCISVSDPAPAEVSERLTGVVTFGVREAGEIGLSAQERPRPARFVDVTLLEASGRPLLTVPSGPDGRFTLPMLPGAAAVAVTARVRRGALDLACAPDPRGETSHSAVTPLEDVRARGGAIHFADTEGPMAGALHIVDVLARGSTALERWTGRGLPPVFAYWGRGVTTEWSYFRGEVPEGSGRFCLELLGGPLGEQARTDTDEHDEGIILHELGHFVMNRLAGDSSIGGRHPPGALVDPGVAWEEGRATWLAMALLAAEEPAREPWYRDTVGIVPTGSTRIDEDVEHPSAPRGLGSERTVAAVLWDLTDGGEGPVDRDDDGVAIGAPAVLAAMQRAHEEPGAFVALPSFLRFLVRTGVVEEAALRRMLEVNGEDVGLLPADDRSLWPIDLVLGETSEGLVDGLSDPSPSGAPARPDNGIDAVRVYRLRLERAGTLVVALAIDGAGTATDRTDLDLQLWSLRARPTASAAGPGATHTLRRVVEPGWTIVVVRDAGTGNRARFRLTATLE
jgi:hypothetical protein